MKITVDSTYVLADEFKAFDRDYYTMYGYEAMLNFYDEIDPNMELDVIAICCEWDEFGNDCCLSFDDMLSDYGYLLDDEDEELEFEEKIKRIAEALEDDHNVITLSNGNYLVYCG